MECPAKIGKNRRDGSKTDLALFAAELETARSARTTYSDAENKSVALKSCVWFRLTFSTKSILLSALAEGSESKILLRFEMISKSVQNPNLRLFGQEMDCSGIQKH